MEKYIVPVVVILLLIITLIYKLEGFDPLANEFLQIPVRLGKWLKSGFDNINLGYYIPAGIPLHIGPCPEGSRDIAGSCWEGKDICDVELPVCSGGCNTTINPCGARAPSYIGGFCIPVPNTTCTEIKCTSGSVTNCPHITKFLTDRLTCGDKENVTSLCYDYCKKGYKKAPGFPYWCIPDFW